MQFVVRCVGSNSHDVVVLVGSVSVFSCGSLLLVTASGGVVPPTSFLRRLACSQGYFLFCRRSKSFTVDMVGSDMCNNIPNYAIVFSFFEISDRVMKASFLRFNVEKMAAAG